MSTSSFVRIPQGGVDHLLVQGPSIVHKGPRLYSMEYGLVSSQTNSQKVLRTEYILTSAACLTIELISDIA